MELISNSIYIQNLQNDSHNSIYETPCAIWYYLHNFKNEKNTHGGRSMEECLSGFLNSTNCTKLRKASHINTSRR